MTRIEARVVTFYSGYSKMFLSATWYYLVATRTHGLAPDEHPAVWDDRRLAAKPLPEEKPKAPRADKGELVAAIADAMQNGPKTAASLAAKVGASPAKVNATLERNKDLFKVSGQTKGGMIWRLTEKKTGVYCFGNPEMERRPRASDWTQADEEQMCVMASKGYSMEQIADALGRSALAVKRRGQKLGICAKRLDFWLDSEIAQLRELAQTHTYEQAAAMGRTVSSVSAKAKRLRISFLKTGEANSSTVYGSADIQRVFELRAKAMTLKEIAAETGMHFSHVSDILNYAVRYREALNISES